jgi:hypothetical protein
VVVQKETVEVEPSALHSGWCARIRLLPHQLFPGFPDPSAGVIALALQTTLFPSPAHRWPSYRTELTAIVSLAITRSFSTLLGHLMIEALIQAEISSLQAAAETPAVDHGA